MVGLPNYAFKKIDTGVQVIVRLLYMYYVADKWFHMQTLRLSYGIKFVY